MRFELLSVLLIVVCAGFVSADFFEANCSDVKAAFERSDDVAELPSGIPFSDDVFDIYVDEEFSVSFELVDKKVSEVNCEASADVSYNIFVSSGLIGELSDDSADRDFVEFYNEKRASGDLDIEAVGIGKKLKLTFINLGLKIASWFR